MVAEGDFHAFEAWPVEQVANGHPQVLKHPGHVETITLNADALPDQGGGQVFSSHSVVMHDDHRRPGSGT